MISIVQHSSSTHRLTALHGQRIEAPRQTVHHVSDPSERPHATAPALDVLTQPAKRPKLGATVRLRTPIDLVRMPRALQVLVEPRERLERPFAQEALVLLAIERELRRPRLYRRRRLVAAVERALDQPVRVRDVVSRVLADDDAVEPIARHA